MYNIINNYVNIFINYVHNFTFVPIEIGKCLWEKDKMLQSKT